MKDENYRNERRFSMKHKMMFRIVIYLIMVLSGCNNKSSLLSPVVKDELIVFPGKDTLFIKTVVWGISGNHHKTFISAYQKENTQYNPEMDFIYQEDYPIYYKVRKDTLLMYVTTVSPIPSNFHSSVIVEQINIDGRKFRDLSKDFEGMDNGLFKIDGYISN